MRKFKLWSMALVALLAAQIGGSAGPKDDPKAIALPKDPKAVVLSYDPGAGGFIRKGPPPYLKIQADGNVTVTSLFDGSTKETKLTPDQLQELLRFVIKDNDFFMIKADRINDDIAAAVKAMGIGIAVGGAAYLVSKAIRGSKVLAFEDLGMEAIREFEVKDMPVTVAVDASGNAIHKTGPAQWRARIGKIPVAVV